ncbi:MAG: hypothetical protein QM791_14860 [Ferruginibacter sp.]
MKRLFVCCAVFLFAAAMNVTAQDAPKVELSKEKKAELKKMKEEHLTASFTEAGLSEDQVKQARTAIEAAQEKSNQLKANKELSDADRDTQKKAINDEKNAKLKEILGDKYKPWNEIRKKQKAAEEEFTAANAKS